MSVIASSSPRPAMRETLAGGMRDVFAGSLCGILSLLFALSYAALIFAGPLKQDMSYGIAAAFITTAAAAFVVALLASVPFTIAGPDSSTSAVTAALTATLVHRLAAEGAGADLLGPTLIVISLGSLITGLFLLGFGLARAGRAIRFIPYPVIGGFLGAIGVQVLTGSIQVLTDHRLAMPDIAALLNLPDAMKMSAGVAIAAVLFIAQMRFNANVFAVPVILLLSGAIFYGALMLSGIPLDAAKAAGWMFERPLAVSFAPPWTVNALARFPWEALPSLLGNLVSVMFVTMIAALLNTTGLEHATHREADLNRDLKALGVANLLSGALGGYACCVSLSRSTLGFAAGATGRLAGLTVAAIAAAMLFVDPGILAFVPKCVLGGLLLFMGFTLVNRWLVTSIRRLPTVEYVSLLAVAVTIVLWGFIAGVAVGIVIGCVTFAVTVSRVNAIKFSFDGLRYRSSLDRSPAELKLLADYGHELQGMRLHSYLFFGSANRLYQHVKALLAETGDCRFLVFDFRLVTGMDSSATHCFSQIKQVSHQAGVKVILTGISDQMLRAFGDIGLMDEDVLIENDLDRTLERCENSIIQAHGESSAQQETLVEWLSDALQDRKLAAALAGHCRRIEVLPGHTIARQGEPSTSMHFILHGRVGVVLDVDNGQSVRVRSLGMHTTIGEMGLLTGRPRSANIVAETASVLYELGTESYERIRTEDPALNQALLAHIVKVMGERLSFANQAIGILQG